MTAPAPTPEQRAAIEARDRDVFLEAGAGTGKTRVLVERYCEAIAVDGVEVDQILAFTFTERAAAELRERVRRSLMERAAEARAKGDTERAAGLGANARATERAFITTIHGFCRRVLAAHPVAAGLDPRFRVLDEMEAARLRDRAFTAALAELMDHGGADAVRAAAAYRPYRLAEMTLAAHARLRSQGMDPPRLPPVAEAIRSADGDDEPDPLTAFELEAAGVARTALEALLEGFHRRYERLKAERSGLDFADLELRALALLRESAAVSEAWRERFAHVLVDEFQDTNRVQLDLIEELRGDGTRLFCVGDEHQSIYRFRNADLQVFRDRRAEASADPGTELLALRGNFRSLPAPLAAVNEAGGALLDGFGGLTWGRPHAGVWRARRHRRTAPHRGPALGRRAALEERRDPARAPALGGLTVGRRRGALPGAPAARAGRCRRGRARRHRRAAARLHPRGCLRGGAGPGRARSLRRRRARVLVAAAGGGPDPAPGLYLEPPRRRAPLRRPRVTRRRREPRCALAPAPGRGFGAPHLAARRVALRRCRAPAVRARPGVAGARPR